MLLVVIHMTHFSRQIFRSSYSSLPRTGVETYLLKFNHFIDRLSIYFPGWNQKDIEHTDISTTSVFSQEVIANNQDKDNFLQGCLTVYTNHT